MPQEKAAQTIILKQKATAEALLKALYTLAKELHDQQEYKAAHRTFIGETNFNDFMAFLRRTQARSREIYEAIMKQI